MISLILTYPLFYFTGLLYLYYLLYFMMYLVYLVYFIASLCWLNHLILPHIFFRELGGSIFRTFPSPEDQAILRNLRMEVFPIDNNYRKF